MIIGFKGEGSRLRNLFKELGLKEVKPSSFEELEKAIKDSSGETVVSNYNEIMVFENPTADLVEKRNAVLKAIKGSKTNVYLAFGKEDKSIDRLSVDVAVCTKVDTNDMVFIEELFSFANTDLPYNGKLKDDTYAVRFRNELRASEKSLAELKKIVK